MTTTQDDEPDQHGDRGAAAEELHLFLGQAVERLDETATASPSRIEQLADAQLLALRAIYHELRHGHDQAAQHVAALAKHAETMNDLAQSMQRLGGMLDEHAHALSRFRDR
jgi:hypothetical protein